MALKSENLERTILVVKDGKIVNSGKIKLPDGTHRVVPEAAIRNIPQPAKKRKGGKVAAKKMAAGGKAKKKSKGMARGGKTMMKSKGMARGGNAKKKMMKGGKAMKAKGMKRGGKAKR